MDQNSHFPLTLAQAENADTASDNSRLTTLPASDRTYALDQVVGGGGGGRLVDAVAAGSELAASLLASPSSVTEAGSAGSADSTLRLPSRWPLPSLRAVSGNEQLARTQWETATSPVIAGPPSFASSLLSTTRLATARRRHVTRRAGKLLLRSEQNQLTAAPKNVSVETRQGDSVIPVQIIRFP